MKEQASIFINIPVKSIANSYTYLVPEKFSFLKVGARVIVPFGHRKMEGFVVSLAPAVENAEQPLKEIIDVIDTQPYFTDKVMQTAFFIAEFYLCSLGEALRLFIPGKSSIKLRSKYTAAELNIDELSSTEHTVYNFILAHPACDICQLKHHLSDNELSILKKLVTKKFIIQDYSYNRRVHKIYDTYIQINKNVVSAAMITAMTRKKAQKRLLEFLSDDKKRSLKELTAAKFSRSIIKILAEQNYIKLTHERIFRNSYDHIKKVDSNSANLTPEQKAAAQKIHPYIKAKSKHTFLLYGITGSGKTRLYIEAAKYAYKEDRQSLILVPEIVLTGQLVISLQEYFSDEVVVIHSRLTVNERADAFMRIRTNNAKIIIGARSAIFAPFADLGLIVMDEEHDASYKQDESPRYHTRDIAQKMAKLYHAVLILGSATPSVESYYYAATGKYTLLTMSHRINNRPLPTIKCIDMREELHFGNRHILSRALTALITKTLTEKRQIIIMLNRRGFSTFVMCRSCGYVVKCPQCDLPLVYHKSGYMQCHHCDIRQDVPDVCPACKSRYIKFFGSGTEKLEEELHKTFPHAGIIRLDRDTAVKKFAQQKILREFKEGHYDILLGTQMVAKGHDIPAVTAVGIISADSSLNMPDFRAAERCFSLITQTAGRAGRGQKPGSVIVQSYNPDHYAVKCGIKQDYPAFYQQELNLRKELFYPPFAHLIKLTVQHENQDTALNKAMHLKKLYQQKFPADCDHQILGPAPAVIANLRGMYRFNLLLKTADLIRSIDFLRELGLAADSHVMVDVNPLNTM